MNECKNCIHYGICDCGCGFGICNNYKDKSKFIELPCKIGDSVDGKRGNWFGTVEEIAINSDGIFLYVSSGGYNKLLRPDEVEFRNIKAEF